MATNIPPHNLGELVDALSVIIQNPEATVSISIIVSFLINRFSSVNCIIVYSMMNP
jgi:DNA gyrase/topoisomerase IV subunit A